MKLPKGQDFVLGLDYGTDSCRAVIIDAADGSEAGSAVMAYPRWSKGLYCDPGANRFRQHPQDYIDSLEGCVQGAIARAGRDIAARIRGIAIDTTGSTPCAVDRDGTPLAMQPRFADNPAAMFFLWKDHTAINEAARINELSRNWGGTDFTRFEGGIYSSEWFWAKVMRALSEHADIAATAASFLEHCDWMPALLTGTTAPGGPGLLGIKHSRCAMGHKAMWHADFGGYPDDRFLAALHPRLPAVKASLGDQTWTSDQSAGGLTAAWAERLHLPAGIPVAVGAYDAHMGAVGGGARPGWMVKVMGTSTCDMIVGPKPATETPVQGICGQVDGSIVPAMLGYEAGQSAFGDVYAWFRQLLSWPVEAVLPGVAGVDAAMRQRIAEAMAEQLIPALEAGARDIAPGESGVLALDWLNGRRTPDADQRLKGAIIGLSLGSDAPRLYRALIEATAYGSRAIVERFRSEGVAIEGIIAVGGVARKSPLVMQIVADVLNMPIAVPGSDQAVALGAAMFAAVVAGIHADIPSAQAAMASAIERTWQPDPARAAIYDDLYREYRTLGAFEEARVLEAALNQARARAGGKA
jgi:L-ribulokinase